MRIRGADAVRRLIKKRWTQVDCLFSFPHMSKVVRVNYLDKKLRRLWARSLQLTGAGSQAQWIQSQIRRFVVETQKQFGPDLLSALSPEEAEVVRVVRDGAAELQHICEETLIPEKKVRELLDGLIDRNLIEARRKGGKTEKARGAVVTLYFVRETQTEK
jgi:hypothetical protein